MRHSEVTLDDKFLLTDGRVFITGVQALLRVLIDQHRLDAAAGLHTAGFVSGYRGSPLGGLDQQAHRADRHLCGRQRKGLVQKRLAYGEGQRKLQADRLRAFQQGRIHGAQDP